MLVATRAASVMVREPATMRRENALQSDNRVY
jgi:hypothetical protein